jgi:trigger factor
MRADEFAQQLVGAGQLGALMADIMRGKALATVMERAVITDASGNEVDLDALTASDEPDEAAIDEAAIDEPAAEPALTAEVAPNEEPATD